MQCQRSAWLDGQNELYTKGTHHFINGRPVPLSSHACDLYCFMASRYADGASSGISSKKGADF